MVLLVTIPGPQPLNPHFSLITAHHSFILNYAAGIMGGSLKLTASTYLCGCLAVSRILYYVLASYNMFIHMIGGLYCVCCVLDNPHFTYKSNLISTL